MNWFLAKWTDICHKFKVAFLGLYSGIKTDQSIRIQYYFAIATCLVAFLLDFNWLEWIILLILIGLVIALEYINSSIERLCNFVTMENNQAIKQIKDLSSGAVLFASIVALVVGIIMVMNHL